MPAIYAADCYCDSCAEAIRKRLKKTATPEQLEDWKSERDYDSDEYPKYMSDDEESDSPQHCGSHEECLEAITLASGTKIGALLSTNLTEYGVQYLLEMCADSPGEVTDFWKTEFDYVDFPPTSDDDTDDDAME